mmetsp:Transcript_119271/g.337378  ORF Transcript_119271/g.337378 Transcript_119271/m.337378 type:complete len:270 (-) Transcript_119271:878-1687(-)
MQVSKSGHVWVARRASTLELAHEGLAVESRHETGVFGSEISLAQQPEIRGEGMVANTIPRWQKVAHGPGHDEGQFPRVVDPHLAPELPVGDARRQRGNNVTRGDHSEGLRHQGVVYAPEGRVAHPRAAECVDHWRESWSPLVCTKPASNGFVQERRTYDVKREQARQGASEGMARDVKPRRPPLLREDPKALEKQRHDLVTYGLVCLRETRMHAHPPQRGWPKLFVVFLRVRRREEREAHAHATTPQHIATGANDAAASTLARRVLCAA